MKPFSRPITFGIALLWIFAAWLLWPSVSEWLWLSRLNKAKVSIPFPGNIRAYAISSQGLLAVILSESVFSSEQDLILVDVNSSRRETTAKVGNDIIGSINFSPNGNKLFGSSGSDLWIANIKDGKIVKQISTPAQKASRQSYRSIYRSGYPIQRGEVAVECISLSSVFNPAMQASYWKINDASFVRERTILPASRGPFTLVQSVLSPDGRQAIAVWKRTQNDESRQNVQDGFIELWDIVNTKKLRELEEINPQGLGPLVFSSDSKYITAADSAGDGYIWETRTGQLIQSLSGLRHRIKDRPRTYVFGFDTPAFDAIIPMAFTTDNRTIIAALNDGYIIAYDRESGLPVQILAKHDEPISRLTVSPGHRNLLFFQDRKTLYSLPLPEFPETS